MKISIGLWGQNFIDQVFQTNLVNIVKYFFNSVRKKCNLRKISFIYNFSNNSTAKSWISLIIVDFNKEI